MELSKNALRNELYSHLFLGLALRTSNLDVGRSLAELRSNAKYIENFRVILSIYDTFNDTGSSSDQGCANPGRLRFFLRRGQIFLDPQYGIAFVSPVWRPEQ